MRPGLILLGLHALASIIGWGVAMQAWRHVHWADRVLMSPISTESVCIHGHGVLLENRWLHSFRRQDSHWEQLIRGSWCLL